MLGLRIHSASGGSLTAEQVAAAHRVADQHKEMRAGVIKQTDSATMVSVEYHADKLLALVFSSVSDVFSMTLPNPIPYRGLWIGSVKKVGIGVFNKDGAKDSESGDGWRTYTAHMAITGPARAPFTYSNPYSAADYAAYVYTNAEHGLPSASIETTNTWASPTPQWVSYFYPLTGATLMGWGNYLSATVGDFNQGQPVIGIVNVESPVSGSEIFSRDSLIPKCSDYTQRAKDAYYQALANDAASGGPGWSLSAYVSSGERVGQVNFTATYTPSLLGLWWSGASIEQILNVDAVGEPMTMTVPGDCIYREFGKPGNPYANKQRSEFKTGSITATGEVLDNDDEEKPGITVLTVNVYETAGSAAPILRNTYEYRGSYRWTNDQNYSISDVYWGDMNGDGVVGIYGRTIEYKNGAAIIDPIYTLLDAEPVQRANEITSVGDADYSNAENYSNATKGGLFEAQWATGEAELTARDKAFRLNSWIQVLAALMSGSAPWPLWDRALKTTIPPSTHLFRTTPLDLPSWTETVDDSTSNLTAPGVKTTTRKWTFRYTVGETINELEVSSSLVQTVTRHTIPVQGSDPTYVLVTTSVYSLWYVPAGSDAPEDPTFVSHQVYADGTGKGFGLLWSGTVIKEGKRGDSTFGAPQSPVAHLQATPPIPKYTNTLKGETNQFFIDYMATPLEYRSGSTSSAEDRKTISAALAEGMTVTLIPVGTVKRGGDLGGFVTASDLTEKYDSTARYDDLVVYGSLVLTYSAKTATFSGQWVPLKSNGAVVASRRVGVSGTGVPQNFVLLYSGMRWPDQIKGAQARTSGISSATQRIINAINAA